jgi:septal ring-binding cell division protein DamX
MSENTKLYVFEKKEVLLLFIFMILIALTSFLLGVKMGKSYSLQSAGITAADQKSIELKSTDEEVILNDQTNDLNKVAPTTEVSDETKQKEQFDESYKKLQDEFSKLNKSESTEPKAEMAKDSYVGKYTIQLGSNRSLADSEKFAEGFRARGYNPIINEVKIEGQGMWYRVSLGIFDSLQEAKDYIIKEKSLFQGQDYVIGRFE